jgi:hypothetical protein
MAVAEQHKIGSGFGFDSTAAEVVDGIDPTGKLAIVTGGYSGIGIETTKALVGAGAFVVVPARRVGSAREALRGLSTVEVVALDLGDLASVRGFADGFLASGRGGRRSSPPTTSGTTRSSTCCGRRCGLARAWSPCHPARTATRGSVGTT